MTRQTSERPALRWISASLKICIDSWRTRAVATVMSEIKLIDQHPVARTPMQMPRLDPNVADIAPSDHVLTSYDKAHLITYLRLLDADAEGADRREVARVPVSAGAPVFASRPHMAHRSSRMRIRRPSRAIDATMLDPGLHRLADRRRRDPRPPALEAAHDLIDGELVRRTVISIDSEKTGMRVELPLLPTQGLPATSPSSSPGGARPGLRALREPNSWGRPKLPG